MKKNLTDNDKKKLESILSSNKCYSYHSLEFMNWIRNMTFILDKNDCIKFYLRNDHPLKTTIAFKKLGHTSMLSYLAPRIEEEFDDDEEELQDF